MLFTKLQRVCSRGGSQKHVQPFSVHLRPECVYPARQVLQSVLTQKGATIGGRHVAKGVAELLPGLVERVGESNIRMKEAALEAVRQLAALPESGILHMTSHIVKCAELHFLWVDNIVSLSPKVMGCSMQTAVMTMTVTITNMCSAGRCVPEKKMRVKHEFRARACGRPRAVQWKWRCIQLTWSCADT